MREWHPSDIEEQWSSYPPRLNTEPRCRTLPSLLDKDLVYIKTLDTLIRMAMTNEDYRHYKESF